MRWTKTFIPTLKEQPAEAEVASHKLMLRAGLIRKLTAGVYSYLPLGQRSLNRVVQIVREEMDASGALEVLLPALQPLELWQKSGRLPDWEDDLMRLLDRHGGEKLVLGPTHEEVITDIVRNHVKSYRQLPLNLYQIQTKFRDEIRPRFGVLRTREFLMKDAYSFDVDEAGLDRSYQIMYQAYCRIFDRAGLNYIVVEAESGGMGGSFTEEFIVPCDSGEGVVVSCPGCGYAATLERAQAPPPAASEEPLEEIKRVDTPGATTIEQVSKFLDLPPSRLVKSLVYLADGEPVLLLVRGDHELNQSKAMRVLGCTRLEIADDQTVVRMTEAPVGFAGPVGLGLPIIADSAVQALRNFVTGANQADAHFVDVNHGRDFKINKVTDLRCVREGDCCARCGKKLLVSKGIEVGQIFKLGTKYSQSMSAEFQDEKGNLKPMLMGCYGIGANRIMAACIEDSHDDAGIIWPISIAPYEVTILALDMRDEKIVDTAEKLYQALTEAGVDVLLDDRQATAGVKFNDADLIGIPLRLTVGKKGLKAGKVELKRRDRKDVVGVEIEKAKESVLQVLRQLREELKPGRQASQAGS